MKLAFVYNTASQISRMELISKKFKVIEKIRLVVKENRSLKIKTS